MSYTVDELAAAARIPTRTLRHYQSERLLPPPRREGRRALYGDEHLRRLRLVAQLQERGLSLRAIRDALEEVERGSLSLEDWLGIGDELRRPWSEDIPVVVPRDELEQRLGAYRPGLLDALQDAGLVREEAGEPERFRVPAPRLLDITLDLEQAGVDVETSVGAARLLQKSLREAADVLVSYFVQHAGEGFGRSIRAADLAQALAVLRPLGTDAVRLLFAHEIEYALARRVDEMAPAVGRRRRG